MKNILYIEPRQGDKIYNYYNYLGFGLVTLYKNKEINLTFNKHDFVDNKYDLIIFGYSTSTTKNYIQKNLNHIKNTPIIFFLFKLSNYYQEKINFIKNNNIIVYSHSSRIPEFEKNIKIKINPTLFAFDNNIFKNNENNRLYDFGMTGAIHNANLYSKNAYLDSELNIRKRILDLVDNTKYNKFIKCSDESPQKSRVMDYNKYSKIMNNSKIWIVTNSDHGDLTPRVSEVLASNTLLFHNELSSDVFNNYLKDGINCIIYKNDLSDLLKKLDYYLENNTERELIAKNGFNMINRFFTPKELSRKLLDHSK
jgi:hypothetical protein